MTKMTVITISIICIILLVSCNKLKYGKNDVQELGTEYLLALSTSQESLIRHLIAPDYNADAEIKAKLAKYQNNPQQLSSEFVVHPVASSLGTIVLKDNQSNTYDEVPCQKIDGKWYLVLGTHKYQTIDEQNAIKDSP